MKFKCNRGQVRPKHARVVKHLYHKIRGENEIKIKKRNIKIQINYLKTYTKEYNNFLLQKNKKF